MFDLWIAWEVGKSTANWLLLYACKARSSQMRQVMGNWRRWLLCAAAQSLWWRLCSRLMASQMAACGPTMTALSTLQGHGWKCEANVAAYLFVRLSGTPSRGGFRHWWQHVSRESISVLDGLCFQPGRHGQVLILKKVLYNICAIQVARVAASGHFKNQNYWSRSAAPSTSTFPKCRCTKCRCTTWKLISGRILSLERMSPNMNK